MKWLPRWPFRLRSDAIAHEDAYCAGSYKPPRARPVRLVERQDWLLEEWLENGGADRLRANSFDREAIRVVYTWKTRANAAFDGGSAGVPEELYSPEFGRAINQVLESRSDSEGVEAIRTLCTFPFVRVRVASAFAYWLRPNDFQLIDRRSTEALDLGFMDADYTPENYVRFCELSRDLGRAHALTLRQIDRALFAYHKLIEAGYFLES
jgi:hypothetical protein